MFETIVSISLNKLINMSTNSSNNTGSNDQNNNDTGAENGSTLFISQVEFDKMIQQLQKDVKNKTNMKILNSFASHIPKKAIKKMNKWLASSHSVLSSNKLARVYHLNTMLDKDTAAQGNSKNINLTEGDPNGYTSVQSHADGLFLSLDHPSNATSNGENVGFPVVEEKINELLKERLTDSIGKQSPTSGKVYDLRSIINANTLPVYKNGSLAYMHRIVETLLHCYVYCSSYNARNSGSKNTMYDTMVNVYGPDDLQYHEVRNKLESRQTVNNLSVVSKAINSGDLMVDLARWTCSQALMRGDNEGKFNNVFPGYAQLNVYSQAPPVTTLPRYNIMNDTTYTQTGYYSFPGAWITTTPTSSTTKFYYYQNRTWYYVEASNAAVYTYFSSGDHNSSVLTTNGSVVIDEEEYTWTSKNVLNTNPIYKLEDWYNHRPLKYTVMENVQDIINVIYILAYLTCNVCWRPGSSGTITRRSICWTEVNRTNQPLYNAVRLSTCSIYSRIAQVYGQIKYLDDVEVAIPTENELSNKVYNLGYYIAGLYAKDSNKRYGCLASIEQYMPQVVKECWVQGVRCVPYDIDEKEVMIPLHYVIDNNDAYYSTADDQNITISDLYANNTNQICYTEYFTEASWWRYDYFGGYEINAPKQQICVNGTERKYDENYDSVFMNTAATKGATQVTGQAMIRWTPDGNYSAVTFAVRSCCLNTAVKFVIPAIFKNKTFVSSLKLHGLDLLDAHSDPVWYAPYNCEAELVDDGSYDQKMLDALFD
jgi:hypothetical protein